MNISDFFKFRTKCPVCNSLLQQRAEVDFGLINNDIEDSVLTSPGSAIYKYNGKIFKKHKIVRFDSSPSDIGNKYISVIDIIDTYIAKQFSIKKRLFPRLNLSKIVRNIPGNFSLFPLDYYLISVCSSKLHKYYYQSTHISQNEYVSDDTLELMSEWVEMSDIRICNSYGDNCTEAYKGDDVMPHTKFSYINIDDWDFSSKTKLENQIEKYKLLV